MKLISSDRKIILEISILGLIGAIFIFIMAFLSFNYEIEILKKSLRDEILKTDKALSYKKAEIYNKISNLSLNLADNKDAKKAIQEFYSHQKIFNSIFFVEGKNTYRANNEKVNFFSYLNLGNFVKDLDEYGFYISRISTIEGKKEFFLIKKLDTDSFVVAFFNSEILKDIAGDNIYLLDANGESVFNGRSFYSIYSQGLANSKLQFLKSDEGEREFAFSLRNRDFDIEIVAHANANTILKKMIFRGIFAFLMFVVMIFLAYNCVQNFKDHYVKALNLFKRVVFTKALTKNLTTKNSDAKSVIDEILSMQSLLKRSRIDIIKANKKFDLIFESDALAYLYIDKIDGSIIFYNQTANNIFDLSQKFSIFDLKSSSYQDEIYNSFASQNLLRDFHLSKYKINNGEYEIYVHENIWLINDEENSSLLYSILDISEHKRFVDETRRERDSFSKGPYVVINYDVVKDRVIHITKNVENLCA